MVVVITLCKSLFVTLDGFSDRDFNLLLCLLFDDCSDCTGNTDVMRQALEACHKGEYQFLLIVDRK